MTNTDFRMTKLLRDKNGDPIPQLWDEDLQRYVPRTTFNDGGGGTGGTAIQGPRGYSAYEIAVQDGFVGDEAAWLESIKGKDGEDGKPFTYSDFTPEQLEALKGEDGKSFLYENFTPEQLEALRGERGADGLPGIDGKDGVDGKSTYQLALEQGFVGSVDDFLAAQKGDPGERGADGKDGLPGEKGEPGADGSPGKDGIDGVDGKSAYQLAVDSGLFTGTLEQFIAAQKGERGETGERGLPGVDGKDGIDGKDGADATLLLPLPAKDIAQSSELQLISGEQKAIIETNKTDIEGLIQRFAQIEQDLQNVASTDELVKGDANDTAGYLSEKVDGDTIKWVNGKLVIDKFVNLMATIDELNALVGINGNVQAQLDTMLKVVNPKEIFQAKSELPALPDEAYGQGITVLVQTDVDYEGATTFYMSTGTAWEYVNKINSDVLRDFLTNPLNIVTETYGTLSKDRYEKQNATETPFTDPTGTLKSNNTNDAIVELLRLADSAKTLIVNAIGFPLLRTDTFEQMAVKILNIKRTFVDLLAAKSVAATEHNTLLELVNKVIAIPNVEVSAGVERVEKMTVTAPYSHQIVLNEPLQPSDITATVIEFIAGKSNQLHYVMKFDSADADRLVLTEDTELKDGALKLKDKYEIDLTPDATYTGEGKLYTATVNKNDFSSIASIVAKARE